ncbi:hypothetical protein BHM03_00011884, partial [Ensete ventricosum]
EQHTTYEAAPSYVVVGAVGPAFSSRGALRWVAESSPFHAFLSASVQLPGQRPYINPSNGSHSSSQVAVLFPSFHPLREKLRCRFQLPLLITPPFPSPSSSHRGERRPRILTKLRAPYEHNTKRYHQKQRTSRGRKRSPMVSVAEMRKQNVIVPEEFAITRVMAAPSRPGLAVSCKKMFSQLDIGGGGTGRIGAWVDSMRASSPTRVKAVPALAPSLTASRDQEYDGWVVSWEQHPSALSNFDDVVAASKEKRVVLFLDYDGTLSPIVDDPDRAFMSDSVRPFSGGASSARRVLLLSLTRIFLLCSDERGSARRSKAFSDSHRERQMQGQGASPCLPLLAPDVITVFSFVQLRELYYAGSHGMDIRGPVKATKHTKAKAKAVSFQPASEFLPMIDEIILRLPITWCQKWSSLAEQVRSVLKDYPKLRLTLGRKVLEIRPSIKWDKGKALEFLLESLGFADCSNVFPIYIGDDCTDEDAFEVLRDREQGLGILVSRCAKETNASYSLREPAEVRSDCMPT